MRAGLRIATFMPYTSTLAHISFLRLPPFSVQRHNFASLSRLPADSILHTCRDYHTHITSRGFEADFLAFSMRQYRAPLQRRAIECRAQVIGVTISLRFARYLRQYRYRITTISPARLG